MFKARIFSLLLLLFLFSGGGLSAQEQDEEDPDSDDGVFMETDWDGYLPDLYSMGDQTFTITAGTVFPIVFYNVHTKEPITHNFSPPVGGAGSLAYTYFLSSNFFLGVEIGVMFNGTMAKNTVFFIPIGVRTGWQFVFRRFEFPLTLTIGVVPQTYIEYKYAGLFIRGGFATFYRTGPEWSFGINVDWNWYPQNPRENVMRKKEDININAHILGITLSARYHF